MKIGIVANIGAHFDAFWVEIVGRFQEWGHEVFLAASDPAESVPSDALAGITRRPSITNLKAPGSIRGWARKHDLDAIITNTATPSVLVRLSMHDIPVVYFAHGFHWSNQHSAAGLFWKGIEKLLVRRTSGYITINDEDQEWLRKHGGSVPTLRLRFGVGLDLEQFPLLPCPPGFNLVWIGELTERKRPLEAVEAMKHLVNLNPKAHLFMLGRGPLRSAVLELIREYGLERSITLPGRVPPISYLAQSRALIHTASWEGLPRVALEALACGRPIIGYSIKGLNGLPGAALVSDGDTLALAGIASAVLDAPDSFRPQIARDELSWENTASLISGFVSDLLRVPD
ncbi:glycosyltransferase [Dietzia sp. 2505]|uniref:glycosyltransferase n=1 Tax=Dietzia sp. 2505 TaxID=3156457 RepID=UPI0033916221